MYKILLITMMLCTVFFCVNQTAAQAQEPKAARYCQMFEASDASQTHNVFSYIMKDDHNMTFALSYWFPDGAHCGITGMAISDSEGGWVYTKDHENTITKAPCVLNIKLTEKQILFTADRDANCRAECGRNAVLASTAIPGSALENKEVKETDLEPELFFNDPCQIR